MNKVSIKWLARPESQDYIASASYLNLLFDKKTSTAYVNKLRKAPMAQFKAKDIFRASTLPLLSSSNSHVAKDRQKIMSKKDLSPILLIRDSENRKVIIADGYHRLCAVYSYDEDAVIPCQIV